MDDNVEFERLRAKVSALEKRLAAVERENLDISRTADHATTRFQQLVDTIPGIVWEAIGQSDGTWTTFVSGYLETMLGYTPEEWHARPGLWLDVIHPDDRERIQQESDRIFRDEDRGSMQYRWVTRQGRVIWVDVRIHVVRDASGVPLGRRGVTMDITARKEAEEEQARLSNELVSSQERLLAELSTPLVPISDEILVMPLIGRMDEARTARALEVMLQGIHAANGRVLIVDITGVPDVDPTVAQSLLNAARAVALLGAEVILTGIRAEVARSLATLDTHLLCVTTHSTLKSGIAHAMRMVRASRTNGPSMAAKLQK